MPDFFMTIVSDSDHWMYLSSNGSLSAGRKNRDNALFLYYTDDKIHDYRNITGSKTYCLVEKNNKTFLWEPFTDESKKIYKTKRNLYKNIYGNKIIFEEINTDLEIGFQYSFSNSNKWGWVKKSTLRNHGNTAVKVEISEEVNLLFDKMFSLFEENITLPDKGFSNADRYCFTRLFLCAECSLRLYGSNFSSRAVRI